MAGEALRCVGLTRPRGPIDGQSAASVFGVSADVPLRFRTIIRNAFLQVPVIFEGAIMPSRYHGIFILCIATVVRASLPLVGRWCSIWFTLNSVSVLLTLPEITHQWSLLGLNLWSYHAADKPASDELLERDATRFSRGEYIANVTLRMT